MARRRCNGVSCGYTRWHRAISRNRFPHTVCAISGDPASWLRSPTAEEGVGGRARVNAESAKISVYGQRETTTTNRRVAFNPKNVRRAREETEWFKWGSSTKPRRDFGLNATTPFGRLLGGRTIAWRFPPRVHGLLGKFRRRVPMGCTTFVHEKRNDETEFRRYIQTRATSGTRADLCGFLEIIFQVV